MHLLNESSYDEEEISSYMNFSDIDDESLNRITNDVRTQIARGGLKKSGLYAEGMLEEGEVIEKTIKGTDIDMLEEAAMVNMAMHIPFMSGDGFSFNRLMFCTNKRVIIISANYYNKPLGIESYLKEDIKSISLGKKVKRQYRLNRLFKSSVGCAEVFFKILAGIYILFIAGVTGYVFAIFINSITNSEFLSLLSFRIAVLAFIYILIARPKLITEVLLETKDGKKYDVIIRNQDYKDIHKYLEDFLYRGKNFDR